MLNNTSTVRAQTVEVFVFGSNLAGRHGKGAALYALQHYGAVYGVGSGRTGNAYAIPTKDENLVVLELGRIQRYADEFKVYAWVNPKIKFLLTRIGCGLAGYTDDQMAPLFAGVATNVWVPTAWKHWLKINEVWQ